MQPEQIPEPWASFLSQVDDQLSEDVELHCFGGFVVTMLYGLARTTVDVDVLPATKRSAWRHLADLAGKGSELHRRYGIYLDFVTIASVPEDYDQRLTEMFPGAFRHLRLLAFDPYDLALAKLERNIQRDRDDVKHLARTIPFDLDTLQERYRKELRPLLGNPDREDLTLRLWVEAIEEDRG
ncbi:MAG TPA: DUF6036 family nucleotidyltransferase [Blastocatellia bacterium]|jgi:hypothetical protein|nr:DUF6036 family nucleotidyltransferase [Blastocatellia bacterium]